MKNTIKETVKEVYNTNNDKVFRKNIYNFNKNVNNNTFRNKNNSNKNNSNKNKSNKNNSDTYNSDTYNSDTYNSNTYNSNRESKNELYDSFKSIPPVPQSSSSSSISLVLFFVFLIMVIIGCIYFFQEHIKEFIKPFFEDEEKNKKLEELQKLIRKEKE